MFDNNEDFKCFAEVTKFDPDVQNANNIDGFHLIHMAEEKVVRLSERECEILESLRFVLPDIPSKKNYKGFVFTILSYKI